MKSIKSGYWQECMSMESNWGSETEIEESGIWRAGLAEAGYNAN